MGSSVNRIVKNTSYLYFKMAVTVFISLWTTRLILNSLGASDFGIFAVVGGAISMLGFLNNSMAGSTQRFMNYVEGQGNIEKKKEIFNISILIHLGLSVVVLLVLAICGYVFFHGVLNISQDRLHAAYVVYGSMIVSTILTVINTPYDAILNSHENMRYYAIVGIFESLLKLLVAFACVYSSYDKLIVYGILMACIPAVTLTIMKIYCHKRYDECVISFSKYYNKATLKEMLGFAGWNFWGASTSMVGNYGQGLVVNHFFGAVLNASIGIASQLNGQLFAFTNNMLKALSPVITKTEGNGDREKMLHYATTGCKFSFAIFAVFAIPFIIEMHFIQTVWLKNVPQWAILFAQLQIVRTLIEQLTFTYHTAIAAEGHIALYQTFMSIFNLVPIVSLCVLFSLGYSPIFMYVVNIVIFGIGMSILVIVFVHRNCKLRYEDYLKKLLYPVLSSFIMAFTSTLIPSFIIAEGWFRFIVTLIVGITSYMSFFWILGLNSSEKEMIKKGLLHVYNTRKHKEHIDLIYNSE